MAESEDTKILSAISTATTTATGRNTTVNSTGGLTRATLAALFAEIEQHDAPVANIIMHPTNYKDIRGWAKDEFDPVTKREMLKTGYVGDIWNSQLRVTKKQTSGTVYALADPEFMGVISVRIDLDQMDAPDFPERDRSLLSVTIIAKPNCSGNILEKGQSRWEKSR